MREKIARQRYTNTDELKQAVTDTFNEVTHQILGRMSDRTWRRISICNDNNGAQKNSINQ